VWLGCLVQEILAQITRRPRVLSLQKFAELRQRAWSCSPAKLQRETGLVCRTTIFEGVPRAYEWYRWDYLL
jgi:hypothetical protein